MLCLSPWCDLPISPEQRTNETTLEASKKPNQFQLLSMSPNLIFFIRKTFFTMVAYYYYTAISFSQTASSELADYNTTKILEVFPNDVIPFQSCTPAELLQDELHCKAIAISKNAKSMHSAGGPIIESSIDIVYGLIVIIVRISMLASFMEVFGLLILLLLEMFGHLMFLLLEMFGHLIFRQLQQWKRGEPDQEMASPLRVPLLRFNPYRGRGRAIQTTPTPLPLPVSSTDLSDDPVVVSAVEIVVLD